MAELRDGGSLKWRCGALENGVVFHPDGTIAPCCVIDNSYRKPISELFNDPFADITTGKPEPVCFRCINDEGKNFKSYRQGFKLSNSKGYRFLDIRNLNACNMKCRSCGPDLSSLWGQELGVKNFLIKQDINQYVEKLVSEKIELIYYTGGEPLLNHEHWKLLELLIEKGYSKNVQLVYNTNGTITKFKQQNVTEIWKHFKQVLLMFSIDAVGEEFNIIRHGGDWDQVKQNLYAMKGHPRINLEISVTVTLLNVWFLKNIFKELKSFKINLMLSDSPKFLSLNAIDERYKQKALDCIESLEGYYDTKFLADMKNQITNNYNCVHFKDFITHTLLLDKKRNEDLLDRLPFEDYSILDI